MLSLLYYNASTCYCTISLQSVSDEKPTAGSKKLVTSKGIYPLVSNNLCGKNITIIGDDLSTFDGYTSTKYYPNRNLIHLGLKSLFPMINTQQKNLKI